MDRKARAQAGAERTAELVSDGMTLTAASKKVAAEQSVAARTVRLWVKNSGIKITSKRVPVFDDFNEQRRYEAGNKLASVVVGTIDAMTNLLQGGDAPNARDVKEIAIAFGVVTDKRRLEDGLATDRTEDISVPAREIVETKLDELAARRRKRKS